LTKKLLRAVFAVSSSVIVKALVRGTNNATINQMYNYENECKTKKKKRKKRLKELATLKGMNG